MYIFLSPVPSSDTDDLPFTPFANRRIPQIFDKPEFYIGGAGYSDIVQGKLGLRSSFDDI
jgi:hypothetical protein